MRSNRLKPRDLIFRLHVLTYLIFTLLKIAVYYLAVAAIQKLITVKNNDNIYHLLNDFYVLPILSVMFICHLTLSTIL